MNKDPWSIAYSIIANKLKTGNIISVKKIDGFMIIDWQEIADKIIKSLFLEDKAIVSDRLPTAEENAIELDKIKEYINILKPNKSLALERMKTEIYQKICDITIPLLTQIINNCFKREYFSTQHKKAELCLIYI